MLVGGTQADWGAGTPSNVELCPEFSLKVSWLEAESPQRLV